MSRCSFDLKKFIEEITFEMWDELSEHEIEVAEIEYASNNYCEYLIFPQLHLIDSENHSLNGTDDTSGEQEALQGLYETTSKLEKVIAAYNKILRKRLLLQSSPVNIPVELKLSMGETDLNKPDQFDNRRFE